MLSVFVVRSFIITYDINSMVGIHYLIRQKGMIFPQSSSKQEINFIELLEEQNWIKKFTNETSPKMKVTKTHILIYERGSRFI